MLEKLRCKIKHWYAVRFGALAVRHRRGELVWWGIWENPENTEGTLCLLADSEFMTDVDDIPMECVYSFLAPKGMLGFNYARQVQYDYYGWGTYHPQGE